MQEQSVHTPRITYPNEARTAPSIQLTEHDCTSRYHTVHPAPQTFCQHAFSSSRKPEQSCDVFPATPQSCPGIGRANLAAQQAGQLSAYKSKSMSITVGEMVPGWFGRTKKTETKTILATRGRKHDAPNKRIEIPYLCF